MMPRSPSFRISVLQPAAGSSSSASGRTTESWSPSAKRASRSLGVIRSKPWNSRMLPQRLATWLSATRNSPAGMRRDQLRDGAAVEDAVAEVAEHDGVGRRVARSGLTSCSTMLVGDRAVVERVDLQQAVAAGDDGVLVGGRPRRIDDRHAVDAGCFRSSSTKSLSASSPSTVENVDVGAGRAQVLGDDAGAADEVDPASRSARSWSASWSCRRSCVL